MTGKIPAEHAKKSRAYKPPSDGELVRMQKSAGEFQMPAPYPQHLAEFLFEYRQSDILPRTAFDKLNAAPKDHFRMFPAKCRTALDYASADAKLVFMALWSQHEDKHGRANGLLYATTTWLTEKTGRKCRNTISEAAIELELRGLIRVSRGKGGNGHDFVNAYLLTCFPDCLGHPPTADYECLGLPQQRSMANDPETVRDEMRDIAARFKKRIDNQIQIVRYTRNVKTLRNS